MRSLKLLTLNLHCLVEDDLPGKQKLIAEAIEQYDADVVFLQEVAQTQSLKGIENDNYGMTLKRLLEEKEKQYHFYYEAIKDSFGKYDEGIGILSKHELRFRAAEYISKTRDYDNWKTRKILIMEDQDQLSGILFATTHFGWSDGYEVFEEQFETASRLFPMDRIVILAGDFNISSTSKEYDYIIQRGWYDIFSEDEALKHAPTFLGDNVALFENVRLDYILSNKPLKLLRGKILFMDQRVSDHFGVFAEIEW